MRFQIRGLVRNESVSISVTLRKRIVSKLHNGVEQLFAEIYSVARLCAPSNEAAARLFHLLWNFLSAGFAQVVCFGHGKACKLLRYTHQALLINHEPKGVPQNVCRIWMEILDLLATVLVVGKIVVHVGAHWARAIQR